MRRPESPLFAVLAFLLVAATFSALAVGCGGGGGGGDKTASASTLDVTYYYLPG